MANQRTALRQGDSGSASNGTAEAAASFWGNPSASYYRARYYDPQVGRFLREDPFGFQAGPNFYAYTQNSPTNFIDPLGLDIVVLEGGPTKDNPIGHTALCVSGSGLFSFGNGFTPGSSCTDYLKDQKKRRDTIVHVIHTTPAQDALALAYLRSFKNSELPKTWSPFGVPNDNCSTRANSALDAAGIPMVDSTGNPMVFPWQVLAPRSVPGTAGSRADAAGAVPYLIPQGSPGLPSFLNQFD